MNANYRIIARRPNDDNERMLYARPADVCEPQGIYIYVYICSGSGHVDDDDDSSARASTRKYLEDAHSWRLYRRKMRVRGSGGSDEAAQDEV